MSTGQPGGHGDHGDSCLCFDIPMEQPAVAVGSTWRCPECGQVWTLEERTAFSVRWVSSDGRVKSGTWT